MATASVENLKNNVVDLGKYSVVIFGVGLSGIGFDLAKKLVRDGVKKVITEIKLYTYKKFIQTLT